MYSHWQETPASGCRLGHTCIRLCIWEQEVHHWQPTQTPGHLSHISTQNVSSLSSCCGSSLMTTAAPRVCQPYHPTSSMQWRWHWNSGKHTAWPLQQPVQSPFHFIDLERVIWSQVTWLVLLYLHMNQIIQCHMTLQAALEIINRFQLPWICQQAVRSLKSPITFTLLDNSIISTSFPVSILFVLFNLFPFWGDGGWVVSFTVLPVAQLGFFNHCRMA